MQTLNEYQNALHFLIASQEFLNLFRTSTGLAVQMRVGIHIGDVVHGVVGSESPRFCEFVATVYSQPSTIP